MRPIRRILAGLIPLATLAMATPAAAQAVPGPTIVYEREVFQYPLGGRPDPFRSLLLEGELGVRVEDLTLRGIIFNEDPSRSVAILTEAGTGRRIQARVGEQVGSLRILAIHENRIEIVIEELGVARRETLRIVRPDSGDATP